MIGLIILLIAGTYIAIWILVVRFSYRLTFRVTESKKKSFSIAATFFLIMYLIPFWDLIPTLIMHKYYCSTQAGFWIYKTPEEWISENPDMVNPFKNNENSSIQYLNNGLRYEVNNRVYYEVRRSDNVFHAINKKEELLKDRIDDSVLAKKIDFLFGAKMSSIHGGGSLEGWRRFFVFIWFDNRSCWVKPDSYNESFRTIHNKFYFKEEKR
jgi:hypothetical protein